MKPVTQPTKSTALVLPLFAVACAIIAALLLLSSGFGTRINLWHFRTGFSLLKVAAYSGLGCAVLALVSGVLAVRKRNFAGVALSVVALLLALFVFGVPYSWKQKAQSSPRIHDISTDLDNPPKFVAILPLREGPVEHGGAVISSQQLKAYPDIKTLILPVSKDQAFQAALTTAREMGWKIVAEELAEGRIEATDRTLWFGFTDDVVIRIFPAGERSLVDIRSVSRVGISDVGTNAERIRTFMAKVSNQAR